MAESTYTPPTELPEVVPPKQSVDLSALPKKKHIWIDRGTKFSCETTSHPYHQVWKRLPM